MHKQAPIIPVNGSMLFPLYDSALPIVIITYCKTLFVNLYHSGSTEPDVVSDGLLEMENASYFRFTEDDRLHEVQYH